MALRTGPEGMEPTPGVVAAHLLPTCPYSLDRESAIEQGRFAMKIKDIMTPNVECVWPDDTLQEAALKMKELEIGPLPVCDRNHVVGMASLSRRCRDPDQSLSRAQGQAVHPETTSLVS